MATRTWLGHAVPIAQVDTITISGTWTAADTATITINGKDLVLTVGTDTSTTQVATAIKEMINGDTQTGTGDHTFSQTGNNVGEFARLTATSSAAVVTVTADDTGIPFTMTETVSTASTGDAVVATSTAATGPNHWDNADNWSGDTVPVDGDTVVFNSGDVSCLYALSASIQPAALIITQAYEGNIGLPKTNTDETSLPYDEYREDYLTLANDAGTAALAIDIGEGEGTGSGRIKIDMADSTAATINVFSSGQRAETGIPAILINGTATATILNVLKGDVGIAYYEGDSGHLATLRVGYLDNQESDSAVVLGSGCDIADAGITINGGVSVIDSATGSGTIDQTAGQLTIKSGAHASIDLDGGTVFYRSTGTATSILVGGGGTLDFSRDLQGRTVSACECHAGGTILDPGKTVTWTTGIDLVRTDLSEVTIDLGNHLTVSPSAI